MWRNTICMFIHMDVVWITFVNVFVDVMSKTSDFWSDLNKAKQCLFKNVGLYSIFILCNMIQTTHIHTLLLLLLQQQHWRQPKHIIYDDTAESYTIILNSSYSIFEHLLPQCTAHYQGYRSKTHTHAIWTHHHHERTRLMLRWDKVIIAPVDGRVF